MVVPLPNLSFTRLPGAMVADTTFLSNTTMPLFARAQGYGSNRQVWYAVRDQPGYAVLQYAGNVGLPTNQGFVPFFVKVPENGDPHAPYRQVTVIGLMPQITSQVSQQIPFPLGPVVLLLLGSYLVALLCTVLPAHRASHVPPAEALRYE